MTAPSENSQLAGLGTVRVHGASEPLETARTMGYGRQTEGEEYIFAPNSHA